MKTESFNSIVYSDETKFEKTGDSLGLREFAKDVVFYIPFDATLNAKYGIGNKEAELVTGTAELMNFGAFAQHVNINGVLHYDSSNFETLGDEGAIDVRIRAGFNRAYGYQEFNATTIGAHPAGTYSFTLKVGANDAVVVGVPLDGTETITDIFNSISVVVLPEYNATVSKPSKIRITSTNLADEIVISAPPSGLSMLTLLSGVGKSILSNAPLSDTTLFTIGGNTGDNVDRIEFIHKSTGNIVVRMYDDYGTKVVDNDFGIWNNNYLSFYAFEFNWNRNIAQLFINGKLFGVCQTGFVRSVYGGLTFESMSDTYKIDEFIVFNKYRNITDYTVSSSALTRYSVDVPYIDINFGKDFIADEVKDVILRCSNECHFILKLGEQSYYYSGQSWISSDGSFSQSVTPALLESKFPEFSFNPDLDLGFRVFFESDGETPCVIGEITILTDDSSDKPARIVGTLPVLSPVDLSVASNIIIETDKGLGQANLISLALNPTAVTLQEIKNAIDAANIPGLRPAKDDGAGHLVLESISVGSTAYVAVKRPFFDGGLPTTTIDPTIIDQDSTHRFVTDTQLTYWNAKQDPLGFFPENAALKNEPNGYAGLDENGKISNDVIALAIYKEYTFILHRAENASIGQNKTNVLIVSGNMTIVKCYAYAQTGPTGADFICDINKNGVSIWNINQSNRIKISDGLNLGTQSNFDTTALLENDLLTIDIDRVGSTVAGSDITVILKCLL